MQVKKIISPNLPNGNDHVEESLPDFAAESNVQLWSLCLSSTIGVLIDFRSAVYRWQAAGRVDEREFTKEKQRLDEAGLLGWLSELRHCSKLQKEKEIKDVCASCFKFEGSSSSEVGGKK